MMMRKRSYSRESRLDEIEEIVFPCLRKPMTKEQLNQLFPNREWKASDCLRELILAELVCSAKFAYAKGGQKYNSTDLHGQLAGKTYYCRFDYPKEIVNLLMTNLNAERLTDDGFIKALKHRLKKVLFPEAFQYWEEIARYLVQNRYFFKTHGLGDSFYEQFL